MIPLRRLTLSAALLALAACSPAEPRAGDPTAPALPADQPTEPPPGAVPPPEAQPTAPEPPLVDASQTQCVAGENYLYSCPLGGRTVVSVCVGNRQVAYRFGPLGDPELELTVRQGQPGVWQGGGGQTHVRFRSGDYDYVVYSSQAGRSGSGVVVLRGGREVRRLDCPIRSSQTEIPPTMVPDCIPVEPDESFDAGI